MLNKFVKTGLAMAGALALSTGMVMAESPYKVGFIYVGPKNDGGWTEGHHHGVEQVIKELGNKVDVTYVENVPEGADAERAIQSLVDKGNKLIFTTSFGFMEPTVKVAKDNPKVLFEHATGYKGADNLTTYNARFYEGRYVIGEMAAKLTKKNVIGYIASFPIPEVIMGINAVAIAARKINPKVEIKVVWANTWFDPGKEADAAKALLDQGADVIMQHTDSTAPCKEAEKRNAWCFGQASDMLDAAPKAVATSIVDNWGPYYVARVKDAVDGKWKAQTSWWGLKEGAVKIGKFNAKLPKDITARANETIKAISEGKIKPFAGPIKGQDGKEILAKGQELDDGKINSMNYYVQGVQGSVPN